MQDKETRERKGYVYILEVKDIDLPVSKIGMTTRDPCQRCDEINRSSTGDFLWEVAHWVYVDDCRKLESLVHRKLAPMRQKRREFFNIPADDAYRAVISILENQTGIHRIHVEEEVTCRNPVVSADHQSAAHAGCRQAAEYAELLHAFTTVFAVKGRPFGQLNKPYFGISDGVEGVQWNLTVYPGENEVRLGVNLEGMKYGNWPITSFILSELARTELLWLIGRVADPDNIWLSFRRDAWQVTSRPAIMESQLGGKEFRFSEISRGEWKMVLHEALSCLDAEREYRGRGRRTVRLLTADMGRQPEGGLRELEISPHLWLWTPVTLHGDKEATIKEARMKLETVHEWVNRASRSRYAHCG